MKHTPGPWIIRAEAHGQYCIGPLGASRDVARVSDENDAHMIAAAPEMLALLKKVSDPIGDDLRVYVLEEIDVLIDRIEGGAK